MSHTPASYAKFVYQSHGSNADKLLSCMLLNACQDVNGKFILDALSELEKLRLVERHTTL